MAVDTPARIAVLGAGPIGLETALYARFLGYHVDIYEKGNVAQNVLKWGHVEMFSPFGMNSSTLGLAALKAQDDSYRPPPADELLTGRQWAKRYLIPLSRTDLLSDGLYEYHTVIAVGRASVLKGDAPGSAERAHGPLRILFCNEQQVEHFAEADVVIDTTGVFGNHNWLGQGGVPAAGEIALQSRIEYGLPDILGEDKTRYAGRRTLLVGNGYSAATNLVALAELASESPQTEINWITRRPLPAGAEGPLGRIANDRLAARDHLAQRANALASAGGAVRHFPATMVEAVAWDEPTETFSVRLTGQHAGEHNFDRIIANVGYRPDRDLYRELQIHECYASEGPMKLAAALLKQPAADCLDQTSGGPTTLLNPEPNFYILGSKSFGRNSNFLFSAGLEQIRDLFTIIGDRQNLDLYSTVQGTLT